jgi:hypothetical protein
MMDLGNGYAILNVMDCNVPDWKSELGFESQIHTLQIPPAGWYMNDSKFEDKIDDDDDDEMLGAGDGMDGFLEHIVGGYVDGGGDNGHDDANRIDDGSPLDGIDHVGNVPNEKSFKFKGQFPQLDDKTIVFEEGDWR